MTAAKNLLRCPGCKQSARATHTRYGRRDDCARCGLWSWGGRPLVDRSTHEARKAAHVAFDPLWKTRQVSRTEAYALLARALGLSSEACHISLMDAALARRVPDAVDRIRDELAAYSLSQKAPESEYEESMRLRFFLLELS